MPIVKASCLNVLFCSGKRDRTAQQESRGTAHVTAPPRGRERLKCGWYAIQEVPFNDKIGIIYAIQIYKGRRKKEAEKEERLKPLTLTKL